MSYFSFPQEDYPKDLLGVKCFQVFVLLIYNYNQKFLLIVLLLG